MGNFVTLLYKALGLNTKEDPARLLIASTKNKVSGLCELAAAVNVNVERGGRLSRRVGKTKQRSEPHRSIFSQGGDTLVASGTGLYRLHADFSRTLLTDTLHPTAPLSYVQVAGSTYYVNGHQKGRVPINGEHQEWVAADYQGPTTRKLFHSPPTGQLLTFFDSQILIASGQGVYCSERFQYNWFRGYALVESGRITMMQPVPGGLFVGTANKTYFYAGNTLDQLQRRTVADFGVIEGTVARCPGSVLDASVPEVLLWASPAGICVGGPDGYFKNLTQERLSYPAASKGCGIVADSRYLVLLQE